MEYRSHRKVRGQPILAERMLKLNRSRRGSVWRAMRRKAPRHGSPNLTSAFCPLVLVSPADIGMKRPTLTDRPSLLLIQRRPSARMHGRCGGRSAVREIDLLAFRMVAALSPGAGVNSRQDAAR